MTEEKEEELDAALTEAEQELEALLTDDAEIGRLAVLHDKLRGMESRIEAMKKDAAARLIAKMQEMGVTSVKAMGRRIGTRIFRYYGVAPGMADYLRAFVQTIDPNLLVPASANIKKAMDAFLDQNPGAAVPPFISVTETLSLVNAKA